MEDHQKCTICCRLPSRRNETRCKRNRIKGTNCATMSNERDASGRKLFHCISPPSGVDSYREWIYRRYSAAGRKKQDATIGRHTTEYSRIKSCTQRIFPHLNGLSFMRFTRSNFIRKYVVISCMLCCSAEQ